ncbi:MAG: biotin/lipoyl-containing protein, partial [Parvibaculum sp.]
MPIDITMPALSPTMEEGNLAKWLVKEGDAVSAGDVIAEIETDKATMEVEAVDEGTVAKILVPAGTEGLKVNAVIAVLAEEGEDVAEAAKSGGSGGGAAPAKEEKAAPAEESKAEAPKSDAKPVPDKAPKPPAAGPAPQSGSDRVFSSPLARRIAKENSL